MAQNLVEKIKDGIVGYRETISDVKKGYDFGKYIIEDIKKRVEMVKNDTSSTKNDISIVAQLGEYKMRFEDGREEDSDSYSIGVALYGALHKNDNRMMMTLYDDIIASHDQRNVTE